MHDPIPARRPTPLFCCKLLPLKTFAQLGGMRPPMADSQSFRPVERPEDTGQRKPTPQVEIVRVDSTPGSSLTSRPDKNSADISASNRRSRKNLPPLPDPGDRIGSHHLLEGIGVGGMGAVYRALDQRLDRQVALKLLPPEQALDVEAVQRFYQEARSAARLDHENIARVYTIGHEDAYHYIAFEFIEGTNIRQHVSRNGTFSISETINYTLQIAGALVHAAERGVVHRDIKPSNIIITPQGRAKLVDMGLARRFERGESADKGLTQTGMTLGTFDYISPEQARDPRDVDVRSDLYSLGCTMYYMLTGRPPFPEGTMVQKLLQHQEEPAPNVRALNPAVPPDLAAVVLKLMAKDRDRRYQSPEQLMRDLLTLAGALGLRSVSPEGLTWLTSSAPSAWERHLVWAVPTLALLAVVGFLFWSSQPDGARPSLLVAPSPLVASSAAKQGIDPTKPSTTGEDLKAAAAPPVAVPTTQPVNKRQDSAKTVVALQPREISVRVGDNLWDLLALAPDGSTLLLVEDGPYTLQPRPLGPINSPATSTILRDRRLTVRAAKGARPVVRASKSSVISTANTLTSSSALLRLQGGQMVFEGIEFLSTSAEQGQPLATIQADGTDLKVVRCLFRRDGSSPGSDQYAALLIENSRDAQTADRPAPTVIQDSLFLGSQISLRLRGPADVQVKDCSFGLATTSFVLESDSNTAMPRLSLSHASVLAGGGSAFKVLGPGASIRLNDSVVASPPRGGEVTLVSADQPDLLDWVGRDNLYGRIGIFLQTAAGTLNSPPVRTLKAWQADLAGVNEVDSTQVSSPLWLQDDPVAILSRPDPSPAFQLDPSELLASDVGARRSPFGPLEPFSSMLASNTRLDGPASLPVAPAGLSQPGSLTDRLEPAADPQPSVIENEDPEAASLLPMTVAPMLRVPPEELENEEQLTSFPGVMRSESSSPTTSSLPPSSLRVDSATLNPNRSGQKTEGSGLDSTRLVVETNEKLLSLLTATNAPSEPIQLAPGAVFDIPGFVLNGSSRWIIQGSDQPDAERPLIRLRSPRAGEAAAQSMFRVQAAALELQNVDLVLSKRDLQGLSNSPAFTLTPGSELTMDGCTVTVNGPQNQAPLVKVVASETTGASGSSTAPLVTKIRVTNSFWRGSSDLIELAEGLPLDTRITNSILASGSSLLHGRGAARNLPAGSITLELSRVLARTAGGLVLLESAPADPDLPIAWVQVSDSILATTPGGEPLVRVDGQDDLERLRDRVRWQGRNVAYHQIQTYRRDQTSRPGDVPLRFDRPDWEVAVAPREDGAYHGEVPFLNTWDEVRDPWTMTREDARIAPERGDPMRGPDLDKIPDPIEPIKPY